MLLSEIVDKFEILNDVCEYGFSESPDDLSLIILKFDNFECSIRVVEDSDEILFSNEVDTDGYVNKKASTFWKQVIGDRLSWGWILKNNQGYNDGMQLEFKNSSLVFQFIVIASAIKCYTVSECEL